MSELLRADYEYQKEIRRRQMSDRAKIGLLVGMNIQQFQTNQLLAQNLQVACHTNALLGQISDTLDQVAGMQATHFEQVQRERHLKEVIYQFDKFLTETEQFGDPVAAAYGVKRLFEVIDRPDHGFTTADLSDLGDKKQFDILLARGKAVFRGLPKEQFEELEEFEKLIGIYHERRAIGFNAEASFPRKGRVELAAEFQKPPAESWSPDLTPMVTGGAAYAGLGCGVLMCLLGLLFLLTTVAMLVSREPNALGGAVCILPFLTIGPFLVWNFFRWQKASKGKSEESQQLRQAQRQAQLDKWEADRKREEAKIISTNQKIDSHNAEIDEKRRQATKVFQATMAEMKNLINGFLGQHPAIQQFVARV